MRYFRIEDDVFEIFPSLQIAVLVSHDIDNSESGRELLLKEACENLYEKIKDTDNIHPFIDDYSQAMKKIKRKKGCLSSIEAMAKRIKKGDNISSINPVVDIYNSVSLHYLITCGGENLDNIKGDMVLGLANGTEVFVPLGESENAPPREGELIYHDDLGAVVRSWLWREADRTKITNETNNILLYMEIVSEKRTQDFSRGINSLNELIKKEVGGTNTITILSKNNPFCII